MLHSSVHWLGAHSLIVSIVAQCFVLYEAVRAREKGSLAQTITLIIALLLATISIELRPPTPPNPLADWMGVVAAALFVVPAVIAFRQTRAQRPDKQDNPGRAQN